jgi:MoaA/NifB/PqqE/SkfB family radical SAM enzyme
MPRRLSWSQKLSGALRFLCLRSGGYPTLVNLEITRRCNARCDFCRYWTTQREARLLDYVPVVRKLKPTVVMFTGGEPLLRRDLERLIRDVRQAYPTIFLGLVTNGALLTVERGLSVWNAGLDQLAVSLDYLDERHDQARGIPGLTRRILDTLPRLVAEGLDNLSLNTVIKSDNLDEILPIVAWAQAHGIKVVLSTYTSKKNGNNQHNVTGEQSSALRRLVDELASFKRKNGVIASSTYYLQRIPEYFEKGGINGCGSGRKFVTVGPDGEVYRCSEIPAACHYKDWTPHWFGPTDCRACWVSCRGETQAPLNWERMKQVAALYQR